MVDMKISSFNVSTTLNDSDLFTFVVNGTNKNIAYSSFKTDLGVTGTLSQVGNPLAAPVLYTNGTNYGIRNMESGAGIIASVSAQNGVSLKWNIAQDAIGFPIVSGLTNLQPVLSSVIAGTGINIAQGTDSLTVSATGVTTPTNTVVINEEADFPIQDATTITLSEKTRYVIGADISSAKRFICEDGFVFTAENTFGNVYTYTGTGDMFSSTLAGGTVEKVRLDAPNCNQVFGFSDTGYTKLLIIQNVRVANAPKWGTYTGFLTTETQNSALSSGDDGLTIAGTGQLIMVINQFAVLSSDAACVQLDLGVAVISNIEINNMILVAPLGGIQLKGAASSANVPTGSLAMMSNSSIIGGATAQLSGITNKDIRWDFQGNSSTDDSISDALIHTSANALVTTITSIGVGVKVNAVFVDDDISRFTSDGTGKLTYVGERATRLPIDITGTILSTGGDKQVELCVAINGTVVAATCVQGTASGTKAAALTSIWQYDFQPNDYVEAFVSNQSTTDNLTVTQAVIRVN